MPRKADTKAVSVYLSTDEYYALCRVHAALNRESLSKTLAHLIAFADGGGHTSLSNWDRQANEK